MSIRVILTLVLAPLVLAACETVHVPSGPVAGGPLAPDEILLVQNETRALTFRSCKGCTNKGGPLHLRFRLNGDNLIYQVAHAPLSNRPFQPKAPYWINVPIWFNGLQGMSLGLGGFDFAEASKVTGADGRTWYVTDWYWNGFLYKDLDRHGESYPFASTERTREHRRAILALMREKIAAGMQIDTWPLEFTIPTVPTGVEWMRARTLTGEAALAAFADPASAYEQHVAAVDQAQVDHSAGLKAADSANRSYQRFVARELTPLTVAGLVGQRNCPGLPYPLEINYSPPETFYGEAQNALRRATCYTEALEAFDPDALADRYEEVAGEESALFSETYGIERFSLADGEKEAAEAVASVNLALERADYLFKGGDITAKKRARARREQQQQTAMMQGLMAGLQGVEQTLQQRHDMAAARIARLQAEAVRNHVRKQRATTAAATTARTAGTTAAQTGATTAAQAGNAAAASGSTGSSPAAGKAPAGPMLTVYQASSAITSLPSDIPHCDQHQLDAARSQEVACTAVRLVSLPMVSAGDPERCTGDAERDVIDALESAVIGGIYRMQSVTRGELEKLRAHGRERTTATAGLFFEQDAARAQHELIEWKYGLSKAGRTALYFHDRTELVSHLRHRNCAAIRWEKPDGSTRIERLDRVQ
ncbi:hypothetical protein SH611_20205 [Geminicoccaceae bacterium 1502E]|nr:hypothetical protein [Geminicoccaceae bacterium 1502E]